MGQITVTLSGFGPTGDKATGASFTSWGSGPAILYGRVTSATLTLQNIRTYVATCYLEISVEGYGAQILTNTFALDNATHTQTVGISQLAGNLLLNVGGGAVITYYVRRTSGSGNSFNVRENTAGYIIVNYEEIPIPFLIKQGGTWRISVSNGRVGGVWRNEMNAYMRIGGIWRLGVGGWG